MLINWKEGYHTDFHNHPKNGCMLKVLDGSLLEYKPNRNDNEIMMVSQLKNNDISYCLDNEIHKIIAIEDSVSLHLYSPSM
jgi:hypothetical protein